MDCSITCSWMDRFPKEREQKSQMSVRLQVEAGEEIISIKLVKCFVLDFTWKGSFFLINLVFKSS